jgi:hypothetical protein
MSKTQTYCKRASVLLFLGVLFVVSPGISQAQERVTQTLTNMVRDTPSDSNSAAIFRTGSYTVPDGKTLVIEHVFIELHVAAGAKANGRVLVNAASTGSGSNKRYPFLFTSQGSDTSGKTLLTASSPLKIYVINKASDPATITVRIEVRVQDSGVSTSDNVAISGYLEPTTP